MSVVDTVKMARVAAIEGLRVASDAVGDVTGSSMRFKASEVSNPAVLANLLSSGLLSPLQGPVEISAVQRQGIPSVSSNCHNVVLTIAQPGERTLPDSLFVKLPMESLATRWFFSIINAWRLESHFFRHMAAHVPLRTPITYATRCQGTRFFLVQENLHDDPSVELFTNPDMVEGPSLELVYRCLDTLARLHACHYGLGLEEREAILPLQYHLFLSPTMGLVSRNLNRLALKPCMKKRPGAIPAVVVQAYQESVQNWDTLIKYWFDGPLSLLHGDSHLGNFFVSGDEMGMLDWQATHWGKGIRDVQYFLIDSLPVETLAAHERELVDYYVQRRGHYGEAIDPEQTWQEYRSLTFHTLMTIVVSIGFGALNEEQDTLMTEILRRAVAAIQRVDYPGWLAEFLQGDR
ncbi:MAG: phosphotransferase [Halioglobus sp.]|nr:phosphotransferase [Halioglobus sp.]